MTAETAFRSDECFSQREFRRWLNRRSPSDINHYELIQGRIVMTPPAGRMHAELGAALGHLLGGYVRETGMGAVFDSSAGYDLPSGDTLEPDFSYVSARRMAAGPATGADAFLRVVPDLVVEVLSPSTARRDQTEKKAIYARNDVIEYWIIGPRRKTVTVFHLGRRGYGPAKVFAKGMIRPRVLPGLRFAVEELFSA